jgi:glucosamine-6-phosphate deaminase
MYEELVRAYANRQCDFSRVRTFNLDEFVGLSPEDPQSYRAYMSARLFEQVNLAREHLHFPDTTGKYEAEIRNAGGIDLLILGIGANGHIAFNEPGSRFDSRTREVELTEQTRKNAEKSFGGKDVPKRAMTMGIGTILEARRIVLLASGVSKKDVVRRALQGPISEAVPASALQMHPNVIAILDEDAA